MIPLIRFYPGNRGVEFLLVVALGVALASSAAWFLSRRLAGKAALRHLVLFSALVCCLALPVLTWLFAAAGLNVVSIPILRGESGRSASAVPNVESGTADLRPRQPDSLPAATGLPAPKAITPTTKTTDPVVAVAPAENKVPPVLRTEDPEESLASFRGIIAAAILIWAAGALLISVRLVRDCVRVVLLRRSSRPLRNEAHQSMLQEIAARLGMRRAPLLLVSSRTVIPLAVGFGRPAIVLPERLLGAIRDDELQDILVHEAAHLRRGDQRIVLLQELAGKLYWPIVSVHALNRELQRAREELCDNVVLAGRDAIGYGETLWHIAELAVSARPMGAAVGIIGGQGQLERRIAGLLDPRRNKTTKTGRKTACLVACLFLAAAAILSATRFAASSEVGGQPPVDPAASAPTQPDSKRTVTLLGKILGPADRPIAGARLYLIVDEWTDPVLLGTSDASGSYRVEAPERKLRRTVLPSFSLGDCQASLIAVAERHGAGWAELRSARGDRYGEMKAQYANDFRLAADAPIAGRIVDTDGKPVAGAVVGVNAVFDLADGRWHKMPAAIKAGDPNLMTREETDPTRWFTPLYPTAWKMIPSATTDSDGRFRLAGVGADRAVRLQVSGAGIRSADVSVLTRGDVVDFTQAVRTKYPRSRRPLGYFYPARANAPEGDQGVLLFGPAPTIEVDPARTIAGVVRDAVSGEPIAGASVRIVTLFGGSATTDRQGRYRILRTEDEPFLLVNVAPSEGDRFLCVTRRFDNAKGLGEITANFDLPRGVVVQGTVLEADTGRPIVSAPYSNCHVDWPGPLRTGYVTYYPLATNAALRGTLVGLSFQDFPAGYLQAEIGSDGRFRMAVPPGPGVLLIQSAPGLPFGVTMGEISNESAGLHKLFPYVTLSGRTMNDGGPPGIGDTLPGFAGAIPIGGEPGAYHAYRVIDPALDAKTLDVKFSIPRGAARKVRIVGPDGNPMRGATVHGLVEGWLGVAFDGSEAEVIGLVPGRPREVTVTSADGKHSALAVIRADDPQPKTIKLEASGSVHGRIVDEKGKPVEAILAPAPREIRTDVGTIPETKSDAEGRFRLDDLRPWQTYSVRVFRGSTIVGMAFEDLAIRPGEDRDLGNVRIQVRTPPGK